MAHLSGLILIDAPASALNNAGTIDGLRTENTVAVKQIPTYGQSGYPYVSAQAFRYWLRTTLETNDEIEWREAPIFRESKIAYTDSNPIRYWDDDLFGYMRAESKKNDAKKSTDNRENATQTSTTVTRVSPFRVSTLVAIAPSRIIQDFGVMARHEGDPVPHEHEFYRSTLKGLLSLDLRSVGTFWSVQKTGFKNLDEARIKEAEEKQLIKTIVDGKEAYRLPDKERIQRISSLMRGIAFLEGGAKLALHYTDVSPSFSIFAVTKGGNHIFNHIIKTEDRSGKPEINIEALAEVLTVYSKQLLSPIYVGWPKGYMEESREETDSKLNKLKMENVISDYIIDHPVNIALKISDDLKNEKNRGWLQ